MVKKKIWAISGWTVALAILSIGSLFSQEKPAESKTGKPEAKASEPEEVVEVTVSKQIGRAHV
jgi:hypothetical protein